MHYYYFHNYFCAWTLKLHSKQDRRTRLPWGCSFTWHRVFSSLAQQNMHYMAYSCSFSLDVRAEFDLLWWERNYCYILTNLWFGMCVFILPEKWSSSYPNADISLLAILIITHVFSNSCLCHILPILTWQAILAILWLQKWVRNRLPHFNHSSSTVLSHVTKSKSLFNLNFITYKNLSDYR